MIYSAYKLNKQGDNIQPWHTPFPSLNQPIVPSPVLTVASSLAYRFLRRQVSYSGKLLFKDFPQFVMIHTVKGFNIVNEAEVDVFLKFSCFFYDPTDVGNLTANISGSSAFSKSSLYLWSSQFTYFWSLAWRILSITLLACEKRANTKQDKPKEIPTRIQSDFQKLKTVKKKLKNSKRKILPYL